jgi:hypothetical protein
MALTAPRGLLVPGPQAVPARYGLFSVAQAGDTADGHWQAGLEFEDPLCAGIRSTLPHCGDPSPEPAAKEPDPGPIFRSVDPFTLIGSYDCSVGGRPVSQAFDIATRRLLAREEQGVEEILWTGVTVDGTLSSSLAGGDTDATVVVTDLTGASTLDPVAALDVLEEAMGTCVPGQGVIHVPYRAASTLSSRYLVVPEDVPAGTSFRTHVGNLVALGAGYPGTGPANIAVAANETWIFGTGQVMVWKGDVFLNPPEVAQAIDRILNNITVYAERTYAVGFSCCLFAVRMSLSGS